MDLVCENCGHLWIDHDATELDDNGDIYCGLCTERCVHHGVDVTQLLFHYHDEDISRDEPWIDAGKV